MSRLEGSLHGLKADTSARADDEDCRHGIMLLVGPARLSIMCVVGGHTARWAAALNAFPRPLRSHAARQTAVIKIPKRSTPICDLLRATYISTPALKQFGSESRYFVCLRIDGQNVRKEKFVVLDLASSTKRNYRS